MTTIADILHDIIDGTVTNEIKAWYHEVVDSVAAAVGLDQGKEPASASAGADVTAQADTSAQADVTAPADPSAEPAQSAPEDPAPA